MSTSKSSLTLLLVILSAILSSVLSTLIVVSSGKSELNHLNSELYRKDELIDSLKDLVHRSDERVKALDSLLEDQNNRYDSLIKEYSDRIDDLQRLSDDDHVELLRQNLEKLMKSYE